MYTMSIMKGHDRSGNNGASPSTIVLDDSGHENTVLDQGPRGYFPFKYPLPLQPRDDFDRAVLCREYLHPGPSTGGSSRPLKSPSQMVGADPIILVASEDVEAVSEMENILDLASTVVSALYLVNRQSGQRSGR